MCGAGRGTYETIVALVDLWPDWMLDWKVVGWDLQFEEKNKHVPIFAMIDNAHLCRRAKWAGQQGADIPQEHRFTCKCDIGAGRVLGVFEVDVGGGLDGITYVLNSPTDNTYQIHRRVVLATSYFCNFHHLSQMFFFSMPAHVAGNNTRITGAVENANVFMQMAAAFVKGVCTKPIHANAQESGHDMRAHLDEFPCEILWYLYAYYRQDFVCFRYDMPARCLESKCMPSWIPSHP